MTNQNEAAMSMAPASEPQSAQEHGAPMRPPSLDGTWLCSWTTAVSFACVGLVQVVALLGVPSWQWGAGGRFGSVSLNSVALQSLQADSLPASSAGFRREDFKVERRAAGSSLGEMSRRWRYQFRDGAATVSVDFPFQGWHELPKCYKSLGWKLVGRERVPDVAAADGEAERRPVVVAKLTKGPGPKATCCSASSTIGGTQLSLSARTSASLCVSASPSG